MARAPHSLRNRFLGGLSVLAMIAAAWVLQSDGTTSHKVADRPEEKVPPQQAEQPDTPEPAPLAAVQLPPPPPSPQVQAPALPPETASIPVAEPQATAQLQSPKPKAAPEPKTLQPLKAAKAAPEAEPKVIKPLAKAPDAPAQARTVEPIQKPELSPEPEPTPSMDEAMASAVASALAKPASTESPAAHKPAPAETKTGRVLLRMLEFGKGPHLEIAWPDHPAKRATLFETFRSCFGLRVALLNDEGRLFVDEGPAGAPWELNLDYFSGFIRQPSGGVTLSEDRIMRTIRGHHGRNLQGAALVRLFPRRVDARLLGGIDTLVHGAGLDYRDASSIRARYEIAAGRVVASHLQADGRTLGGRIDLGPASCSATGRRPS